ncbi:MAG: rhamnogalacturonan acetylesterase [Ferruginibacter sp.]|nr:rhamnogalacturonan acetylesterase [Ferruginibacter sp.]
MKFIKLTCLFAAVLLLSFSFVQHKPVLYIIGDSTVKNGDGRPNSLLQGWGSYVDIFFDTNKISVENHAIGGRSSRTFITEGRWDKVLAKLQKGDYVLMQFGHNDSSPLDDTARARGTLKGIGNDSTEIYNPIRKQKELVHTYGWYMSKFINDAKARGAVPVICSPIPRNDWKEGKVTRSNNSYALWAKQVAEASGADFIDLNNLLGDEYEKLGKEKTSGFFPQEHTHTNKEGALFNAGIVVQEIKILKTCMLKKYLL